MENLIDSFIGFLVASSLFLLALGALSCLILNVFNASGKARLAICSLLFILPLAYPIGSLVPDHYKIMLPTENLKAFFPEAIEYGKNSIASSGVHFDGSNEIQAAGNEPSGIQVSIPNTSESGAFHVFFEALNYKQVILLIWIVLFALLLLRSFFILKKIKLLVRCADKVTAPDILAILQQCKTETGLHRCPRLLVVDHIPTPMAVGFFHSAVILPKRLTAPEFREGIRFTLLHELKHLQRRDNWWLFFESLVGTIYFFHPVIYWAKRKIHEEWEHICDRHVIQVTNKPASYAEFLLHEIWNPGGNPSPSLAVPLIFKPRKTAKRVHAILEKRKPTLITKIRERAAVGIVFVCFFSLFLFTVTPFANVNKDSDFEKIELQKPNHEEISLMETQSPVSDPESAPEPAPVSDTENSTSTRPENVQDMEIQSPNDAGKDKAPILSPTKEEKPSIETEITPTVLAGEVGIVKKNTHPSVNDSLFEASGLLAMLGTEPLLDSQELSSEILNKAEKEKSDPDRNTFETSRDETQNRSATDLKREPESDNVSIPMGARITDWKVIDDRNIIIVTQFYGSFKATLTNEYSKLSAYSKKLGFTSNWPYELDTNSRIILTNGDECRIQKLVPYNTKRGRYTMIF